LFHWIRALLGPQGTPSYSTELEPHTGEVRLTVTWGKVDASTQAEAVCQAAAGRGNVKKNRQLSV